MQLTERNGAQQNIIDGQQRLSTFFVLFKILKHIFPEIKDLQDIPLNWLNTRVSNGIQQSYLEDLINSDLSQCNDSQNPYLKNALLVKEMIEEELKDDEGNAIEFNVSEFIEYLYNNIYFVVIETKAGLSKTLQIFNAINTTGLDLNGGDIFKLRMFEYLEKKENEELKSAVLKVLLLEYIDSSLRFVFKILQEQTEENYELSSIFNSPKELYSDIFKLISPEKIAVSYNNDIFTPKYTSVNYLFWFSKKK